MASVPQRMAEGTPSYNALEEESYAVTAQLGR
jgi:hypothetical protein